MSKSEGLTICPHCNEPVPEHAAKCPFCAEPIESVHTSSAKFQPDFANPVVLPESRPFWFRPDLKRIAILAGSSFCAYLNIHFAGNTPFTGDIFIDFGGLIGGAFVPFAPAYLFTVFIKGRAGIVIGLVIVVAVSLLFLYGQSLER